MNKLATIVLINLLLALSAPAATAAVKLDLPIATGPFEPSWESLAKYECPEWFRDAKFGIWACMGPQCEPEAGDWYARGMYMEGNPQYKFHLEKYGHPSEFGFKDVINLWKAEKFDPEKLIALYKKAGAQYFVMMANHHDNFDNWNSKHQPWNSVAIGPKKDLVGMWEKATRAAGLRFGVSVHSARTWDWFEVSQMSDKTGAKAGVPYDGNLTKADGKGKWWEGLDPQDLYAQRHKPSSNPVVLKDPARIPGDPPTAAYCQNFYDRVIDLVDSHKPDLLYFDDAVLPLNAENEKIGLSIAAHLYNANTKWHNGRNDAVMNTKKLDELQRKCLVWDIERGVSTNVEPFVWQTDTCIGNWHYRRSIFEEHSYKTTGQVVQMLLDIVSKNGNLLLSIPIRGDGTLDDDEIAFLEGMGKWMAVNSECIFGTSPWKIYGEGPAALEKPEPGRYGGAKDVRSQPYTAEDFRFTTRNGALYAAALAWPANGKLIVRTLGSDAHGIKGNVSTVTLLGSRDNLSFKRTSEGLEVALPKEKPCDHAFVLKISGLDLAASQPVIPVANATKFPTENQSAH